MNTDEIATTAVTTTVASFQSPSSLAVSTTQSQVPYQTRMAPHLPFRNISLPSGPSSVLSVRKSPWAATTTVTTTVAFFQSPSSLADSTTLSQVPYQTRVAPHLPFRRISLPSGPPPVLSVRKSPSAVNASGPIIIASVPPRLGLSKTSAVYSDAPSILPNDEYYSRTLLIHSTNGITSTNLARESKRARVVTELLATERAYVAGLDLIYDHFLEPLLSSLAEGTSLSRLAYFLRAFVLFGN